MANYFIENDTIIDPLNNWLIFNKLRRHNPESFLEIGSGQGSMVWRVEKYLKIPCVGVETAHLFHLLRCTDNLIFGNYVDEGFNLGDKSYDFVYSYGIIDLIPQHKRRFFCEELERISERGFHIFEDENFKNYLPKNHDVHYCGKFLNPLYDYPEYYAKNNLYYPLNDDMGIYENITNTGVKLNFGSGNNFFYSNWSNLDYVDYRELAKKRQALFYHMDMRNMNSFTQDLKVICVNLSHILECLSYVEAMEVLKYCYKVLIPGGSIRIAVQDKQKINKAVQNQVIDDAWHKFITKHVFSNFTKEVVFEWLEKLGFTQIVESKFNMSDLQPFSREIMDIYADFSTYIEARKLVF